MKTSRSKKHLRPLGTAVLELELLCGDLEKKNVMKNGSSTNHASRASSSITNRLVGDAEGACCDGDEEEESMLLTNVGVTFQLRRSRGQGESGGEGDGDSVFAFTLFPSLAAKSKHEWLSAEAARRGIFNDLHFMRENGEKVRQAMFRNFLNLLEVSSPESHSKRPRKIYAKEGVQEQYEKMKKRLAERFSLYFRRSIRRAILARRQTETESVNMKAAVVPKDMLMNSLNRALLVDESKLQLEALSSHNKKGV